MSISQKIWLSLSILIVGYSISTGFGFILGRQTESRLNNISEYLFTATIKSRLALSAFEEQIKSYNDLIMIGNMGNAIESSQEKAEEVQDALQSIIELRKINPQRLDDVRDVRNRLKSFSISALATYTKIRPDSEYLFESADETKNNLENEIFHIGQQTNELRDKLNTLTKQFSEDLRNELADISRITLHYRYLDMTIFLCSLLILAVIVSFILSKHVLRPIRQLAKGTQALSSFEFETKININTKDELGQLASLFNMMAQTLKRYEHMQKQWISDISHELRTPLSILQGEIEALQDGIREIDYKVLDSLSSEVFYISKIIDDLLQLSLAEVKTLHYKNEPLNPLSVLKDTLRIFENRLLVHQISVEENLRIEIDNNVTILGDEDRLKQVFSNILENTLRYSTFPGTLKIWQHHTKTSLFLYFEDSGPGVPEESIDRLFDRLYRVDKSRSRVKGGSGLGLAICKNIIEAHSGKIRAVNAQSGGLRIEIILPLYLS